MRVSVVIPHYFAKREPNLRTIVAAHQASTRPPDEIVIWNNDAPLTTPIDGARVIQSPWNLGCKARFLAALVTVGDWILFQDNDLMPEPAGLENLLRWSKDYPRSILSFEGRRINSELPYRMWKSIRGSGINKPTRIDITLGRMELVRRDVLMMLLAAFPFRDSTDMDDLAFSVCARTLGTKCFVVPYAEDGANGFVKLDECGVGMSITKRKEYLADRDRCVREWGLRAG